VLYGNNPLALNYAQWLWFARTFFTWYSTRLADPTTLLQNRGNANARLLDDGWLSLTVVDPERDGRAFDYEGDLEWSAWSSPSDPTGRVTPPTADDD